MYIFIDESGDFGFDFTRGSSSHIVITALVLEDNKVKVLQKAVLKTIRNKINIKRAKKKLIHELKGSNTNIKIKKYFWRQVHTIPFRLYTIILNKRRLTSLQYQEEEHLLETIFLVLIGKIPIEDEKRNLFIYIDKFKPKKQRENLNKLLIRNIKARLRSSVLVRIYQVDSSKSKGIQAADMFAWGILRKYCTKGDDWYQLYKKKTAYQVEFPNYLLNK